MVAEYKIEINTAFSDTTEQMIFTQGHISDNGTEVLLNVSLNKQMYEYACLEVEVQTIREISKFRKKLITLYKGGTILAKDYFIFNIKQRGKKVILKAYSPDYFLTIDKFCQAFTAKTLVNGIIKPSLKICESEHITSFKKIVTKGDLQKIEDCVVNNVQNFLQDEEETIIPYAVQYNESLYDFMVRLCSRDGEFLYFGDDNRLHIGVEKENVVDLEKLNAVEVEYIDSYGEANDIGLVDLDYLSVSADYKEDAENESENKLCSCFGVLAPEYLEQINMEEYNSILDYTHILTEVCTALRSFALERTLKDSLMTTSRTILLNVSHYDFFKFYFNEVFKRTYPNGTFLYSSSLQNDENNDEIVRNNDGYQQLYKIQEEVKKGQLKVFTTEYPNVKLGDIISDGSVKYVLYQIKVNSILDSNNNYKEECELFLVQGYKEKFYPLPMPDKRIRIASAQRAIVVDNFDPDRLGRVRVLYPWQKKYEKYEKINKNDINSTPWIRISTTMASDGAGFVFAPTINDEVLVDYENGNIERPYVCGSFYNNTHRPSIPSRSHTRGVVKSITSSNGHHLSFVDNAGGERYIANFLPLTRMMASFGFFDQVAFNGPYSKYFGGGFELADYYGIYSITGSTHNRSINISSPFGTVNIDAFQGITIEAPMGDVNIVGKNVNIEARNNLSITSGTNITGYFNKDELKRGIFEGIGSINMITGVDLSFLRTYLEVILRPIGGTMLIKSNRYMCLEAGKGNAIVYRDRANNKTENILTNYFKTTSDENVESVINSKVVYVLEVIDYYKKMCEAWEIINPIIANNNEKLFKQEGKKLVTSSGTVSESKLEKSLKLLDTDKQEFLKYLWKNLMAIDELEKLIKGSKLKDKLLKDMASKFRDNVRDRVKNWTTDYTPQGNVTTKEIVYKELKYLVEDEKNLRDIIQMDDWADGINLETAIKDKEEIELSKMEQVRVGVNGLCRSFTNKYIFSELDDEKVWTSKEEGAILFSDREDKSFLFDAQGNIKENKRIDYREQILSLLNSLNTI